MSALRRIWPGGNAFLSSRFSSFLAYGSLLFALLGGMLLVPEGDIREGQLATRDIVAPENVEIVDVLATEKRRGEILAGIPPVYRVDEGVVHQVKEEMEGFFVGLEDIRAAALSPLPEVVESFSRKWNVTENTVRWLLEAPKEAYEAVRGLLYDLFAARFFTQPVRREDLARVLLEMNTEIEKAELPGEAMWVAGILVTRFLRPNAAIDEVQTQEKRAQILASLEPVRRVIRRGEVLLRRGDIVTREHLQALEALGMVGENRRFFKALSLGIFIVGVVVLEYLYLRRFALFFLGDNALLFVRLMAVCGVLVLHLLTLRVSPVFLVAGAIPLILLTLAGWEVALGESLLLFPLLFWAWRMDLLGGLLLFVHLFSPVFLLGKKRAERRHFTRVGEMLALFCGILGILFALQEGLSFWKALAFFVYGGGGGILASVVALGSVSLFEHTFHLTTEVRLMELLNPNHPLLKRLMLEAPGTYSHSLIVANLAEVAAQEIGANALLARAGAYYHDIGKLRRPQFFIENQASPNRNVHERLSPYLSVRVIIGHVRDGLEMARKFRLPREVQGIIQSHHGRSVVRYFYEKALRMSGGNISRDVFRYPGPLPHTPEEAIVFLADSVEAAVRSMKDPTPRRIEMTVRNIIRAYLEDGQLDESSLTLRDINRIARRFVLFLNGMIHARVPYPEPVEEGVHGKS
jgi:putative nucleotidyltransferase with HDIG domain